MTLADAKKTLFEKKANIYSRDLIPAIVSILGHLLGKGDEVKDIPMATPVVDEIVITPKKRGRKKKDDA